MFFLARSCPVAEPRCNERNRALRKHRRQHFEKSSTQQPKSMCLVCWLIRRMKKQDNSLFPCVIEVHFVPTVCLFVFSSVVVHYALVTHIVNPGHFYVRYLFEHKAGQKLAKKINEFCSGENCHFTSSDEIKTGMCM